MWSTQVMIPLAWDRTQSALKYFHFNLNSRLVHSNKGETKGHLWIVVDRSVLCPSFWKEVSCNVSHGSKSGSFKEYGSDENGVNYSTGRPCVEISTILGAMRAGYDRVLSDGANVSIYALATCSSRIRIRQFVNPVGIPLISIAHTRFIMNRLSYVWWSFDQSPLDRRRELLHPIEGKGSRHR
jgi:hypothetical protein